MKYIGGVPVHVLAYVDGEVLPRCRRNAAAGLPVFESGDPDVALLVLGLPARTETVTEPFYIPAASGKPRRKRKRDDLGVIRQSQVAS